MKTSESYLPEGSYMVQPAVRQAFSTLGALRQAQDEGRILEAVAQRCTAAHDLLFDPVSYTHLTLPTNSRV